MDKKIIFAFLLIILVFALGCLGTKTEPIIKNKTNNNEQNNSVEPNIVTRTESVQTIKLQYFAFQPNIMRIEKGTTVIFENIDESIKHQIVSGSVEKFRGNNTGLFDSGEFITGESWNYTFNEEGVYPFYNPKRVQMQGLIIVGQGESDGIQIMTPHFVGSIPTHNKVVDSLDEIWITFNVPISTGSNISVYNVKDKKYVELKDEGIDISNYIRLKAKFVESQPFDCFEPYRVSYTEVRPEGIYEGQFFFSLECFSV